MDRVADVLHLRYDVGGDVAAIDLAVPVPGNRKNELWKTTCFEAFLRHPDAIGYEEFNFAPSGDWAAYRFDDYRSGMVALDGAAPSMWGANSPNGYMLVVALPLSRSAQRIALSAIIEEVDGTKSYWALRHPPGAPDFHHPDCFALELPAVD